ncbi:hypothetical protein A8H39_00960 [Paraburkholderia fungorum]|uniref:type 4 pilus major pilin n=1 Tax=Paraburkholderia fungorum TaxID=134537 RepID=UPI0009DF3A3E|nr:type 4 pilus major pilin [Paraburkholderia fungorum]MBB5547431.1 hypothetical protein [Paraburkholderia fungorum]PNE52073.1 hypothetical protein A8H39_41220 [Paraburkholderia fungorum]PNE59750.1 hypothetical protein A8H39_00960 [Paraburkholderia fungorum]
MDEIMGSWFKYLVRLLGIAAVVAVLVSIFSKNKAETEVANLTQLSSSIQNAYTGQTTFAGLTTSVASNIAPSAMVSGTTLVNQWGGDVTVQVDANSSQFDVIEDTVPSSGCIDLVEKASNYVQLTLDGTTYTSTTPLSPAQAISGCNSASTQNITFVFGH